MHPSFEQFIAALRDPAQRPGIGLAISDEDAAALLTNASWANDYYARWIELFPPAAPEPAAAVAAFEPATAASAFASAPSAFGSSAFGPPPSTPTSQPSPYAAADVPSWAQTAPRRSTSPARIAIIAVLTVVTLAIVAGVVNEIAAVTRAPVAAKTPVVIVPTPSTPADTLPDDLHGLSAREYPLVEAIFESRNTTIPIQAAQGLTDDQLRAATDRFIPIADTACAQAAKQPNGFDDPDYKSSFVAGYVSTSKVTPEKAGLVYDAIEQYCTSQ